MVSGPGQQDKSRAPDFFISRAGSDAAFAEKIGSILENDGFNVVLQQWDFGNQSFMNAIHVALQCGARVISLLSQEYMKSPYCAAEWQSTLAHDPLNKKQKLIIYRVIDCIPTGLLSAIPYIDLVPIRHDASLVRDVVLGSIRSDVTRGQGLTALQYWREPITILHPEIRKVPRFLGRKIQLEHIGMALWPSANRSYSPGWGLKLLGIAQGIELA